MRAAGNPQTLIIELGSGTGSKTRHILTAAATRGHCNHGPIDISGAALENMREGAGW